MKATPAQQAKLTSRIATNPLMPSEHDEQVAVFAWAATQLKRHPELALMFAIPNAGKRHVAYAVKLRDEGLKAGIPDIFLPVPHYLCDFNRFDYHGLWIEMKRKRGGVVSPEQKWWHQQLTENGYRVVVARGAVEAIAEIENYLR
jgi:VRR-NUC domain